MATKLMSNMIQHSTCAHKAHKGHSDVGFYCSAVREIMLQDSKELFDTVLAEKSVTWHATFKECFNKHILTDVESIAKFHIKPVVKDHFNDITGIMTNPGEGLNNLFKMVAKNTKQPVDVLCLSLRQLSVYYLNEILLAFGNQGIQFNSIQFNSIQFKVNTGLKRNLLNCLSTLLCRIFARS